MSKPRAVLIWAALICAASAPIVAAAFSPQLAWRDAIYIIAGFAGIAGLALMVFQPLLAGGYLPGVPLPRGRRIHRLVGAAIVSAVIVHVLALWITSPPDVVDALLFVSPTTFSVWGVIAMWAVFAAALLAVFRRRLGLRLPIWRLGHTVLVAITVFGTVVHALLIEGTMEPVTKTILCGLALFVLAKAIADLRVWAVWTRRNS